MKNIEPDAKVTLMVCGVSGAPLAARPKKEKDK